MTYQERFEIFENSAAISDKRDVGPIMHIMDKYIQAAFIRGRAGIPQYDGRDQVSFAAEDNITDPTTLAVIYSKEQGFRQ